MGVSSQGLFDKKPSSFQHYRFSQRQPLGNIPCGLLKKQQQNQKQQQNPWKPNSENKNISIPLEIPRSVCYVKIMKSRNHHRCFLSFRPKFRRFRTWTSFRSGKTFASYYQVKYGPFQDEPYEFPPSVSSCCFDFFIRFFPDFVFRNLDFQRGNGKRADPGCGLDGWWSSCRPKSSRSVWRG